MIATTAAMYARRCVGVLLYMFVDGPPQREGNNGEYVYLDLDEV